ITRSDRRQNANTEAANLTAARSCCRLHRLIELKKCCTRLLQESDASVGDPYPGVVPLEKRDSELVLQFAHTATDRRLPDAQNGRNAPETQIVPDEKCLSY